MANSNRTRELATRIAMMPRDTNGHGNIFGGVLLSNIDIAGAIVARTACPGGLINRVVTRAMDKVEFKKPVLVDDTLTCYGSITDVGRTSVTVHIDVEVDRGGAIIPVTEADVVYVCVDASGKPQRIACAADAPPRRKTVRPDTPPLDPSRRVLALRKVMMPAELNGGGNIFGGVLLSYMDLTASYVARRVCVNNYIQRCVTRLMDRVEFKQPVRVNDVITCYGTVTRTGNTSITVHVEVEADRDGTVIQVTSADLVFVALDEDDRPTSVTCTRSPGSRSWLAIHNVWRRLRRKARAWLSA